MGAEERRWGWAVVPSAALLLALLVWAAGYAYVEARRDLTRAVFQKRQTIALLAADLVAGKLDRHRDLALSLSTRVEFGRHVAAREWDAAVRLLESVPRDFPDVERVFLADARGVLRADHPPLPGVRGVDFSYRDWYKRAVTERRTVVTGVYRRKAEPAHNVVAVAAPVAGPGGALAGILVLQVRPESFLDWSRSLDAGAEGLAYFVDDGGRLVAHPLRSPQAEVAGFGAVPAARAALAGRSGAETQDDPLGAEPVVAAYAPVPGYGWGVVVQQTVRSAFAARDETLRVLLAAYAAALLAAAALAFVARAAVLGARERLRMEREVSAAKEAVERANKELEAFNYSVAHDLRAPLRAIKGFGGVLGEEHGAALGEKGRALLARVTGAAERMGQLIDDLMRLSRVSRAELRAARVDLSALAREVLDGLAAQAPERRVERVVAEGVLAQGDPALLRVVLENLLGNAWKYTAKRERARIEFGAREEAGRRAYFVRDDGAGFDMAYAANLFVPFQRLHPAAEFEGSGVGLATVARVVQRHGGRVWAEGAPGKGATFYFTLG